MKITNVEHFQLDLPLRTPYTIAYETIERAENVILKITTASGHVGWGCAAPDPAITHETGADVLRGLSTTAEPLLLGENAFRLAYFDEVLRAQIPSMKTTRAAVDLALHDLLARKADLPLYQLLGGYRREIPTSVTIGILPLDATLELADAYWREGFYILKLKGGLSLDGDVEKIHKLRERLGSNLVLRFDANQGYTAAQAVEFIERTRTAGVEILEQPTAFEDETALKQVTHRTDVPVMADESLRSLKDAFRLSSNAATDMINVKLQKVGGLTEGRHINSVAKAAGIEIMVGCLDECALGISAGLHYALSRPNIEYADLDGHLDLLDDPFAEGLFRIDRGRMIPSTAAGLGEVRL